MKKNDRHQLEILKELFWDYKWGSLLKNLTSPLLKPLKNFELIPLASLEDILSMKVNALIQRGSRKDFIDIYFIIKYLDLKSENVISFFIQKYGKYEELEIKKGLTYFEDVEKEPEFPMIKKVYWDEVKSFSIKEFAKI